MPPRFSCLLCRGAASWAAFLLAACFTLLAPSAAVAQRDRIPSTAYYAYFGDFYEGRFGDAVRGFNDESRGSIKGTTGRWIDAICYHTMAGECHYHMGRYPDALEQYTAAVHLYLKHANWMIRLQPVALRPATAGQLKQCPWGRSTRVARIAEIPQMQLSQGRLNNLAVVQQGGVVEPPRLVPINAAEIVRCTALAIRRRTELLGPAGPHDALNTELVTALSQRPVAPNDWKNAWVDILLALAYSSVGNDGQAKGLLQRGLLAGGEFDHQLTGVGLFELGRISLSQGDLEAAARWFEEASYSAFHYDDFSLVEEALRFGQLTHLLQQAKGPYPPLELASGYARTKRLTHLQVSCTLSAAECMANLGRSSEAAELLATARTTTGNRDMGRGKVGARLNYLAALVSYQQGNVKAGDEALAAALAFQRSGGSLWLHYIGLVDRLRTDGAVSDRIAMALYEYALREPQRADWRTDPLESLSVLSTPHPLVYEHWLEAALERKDLERALEISDLMRRHRFLSTLPLGGRLLNLSWMLEGPDDLLDQEAMLDRQDLMNRHVLYHELAQQVRRLRDELQRMPLVTDDATQQREQADKLTQMAELSARQELLLREVAVRREPCALVFPPKRSIKQLQASMGEHDAMLVFLATSRRLYAALIGKETYPLWEIGNVATLRKQIEAMLRGMGNYESNHVVSFADLRNDAWADPSKKIAEALFKGSKATFPGEIQELTIVPDSFLWYLPFEALMVGEKDPQPLITQMRLRYTPTIALAIPDSRVRRPSPSTAIVAGKLYPGASDTVTPAAVAELREAIPGTVALRWPLPGPSPVYATLFDRMLVLDDIVSPESGPYAWSPVTVDKNTPSSLEAWLALPWGGPDQVLLPGFHTPAENSLKKLSTPQAGADLFFTSCAFMASGTRTLLISRWRTGGQTSVDLSREFLQELPHAAASAAWQRSVFLTADSPVVVEQEPRIRAGNNEEPPTASHPFFWSGYLLVDTGAAPFKSDDAAPQEDQLKPGAAGELRRQAAAPAK